MIALITLGIIIIILAIMKLHELWQMSDSIIDRFREQWYRLKQDWNDFIDSQSK